MSEEEYKGNIDLEPAWTFEKFAKRWGYSPAYIKKQTELGYLEIFHPRGRECPKITRRGEEKWIEDNSYFKDDSLHIVGERR